MPHIDLQEPALSQYRSSAPEPADFDAFWTRTVQAAVNRSAPAAFRPTESGLAFVDTFDVEYSGFAGQRVRAWLHLPKSRTRPLPGVVQFIGYNGGRGLPHQWTLWASAGYAHLVVDTRGQGTGNCPGDTPDIGPAGPSVPGFMTRGIRDPQDYYYRRVIGDAAQAVRVLAGHPDVDPARLTALGGSQGGGLALAVAGLSGLGLVPPLVAALPDVPFLCDFRRAIQICDTNPYQEIVSYLRSHRDEAGRALDTLGYFDGVHFARRATAPALFSVAHMDLICPPSTVYAAYNAYGGPKQILAYPYNDHEGGGAHHEAASIAWLREHHSA